MRPPPERTPARQGLGALERWRVTRRGVPDGMRPLFHDVYFQRAVDMDLVRGDGEEEKVMYLTQQMHL